jgi:hypothetical protein
VGRGSPPDATNPVIVDADGSAMPTALLLTFDQVLVAGSLNLGNWSVFWGGRVYSVASASASADQVIITGSQASTFPFPDQVSFSPPPFDVVGASGGLPAAAFSAFPIT